MGKNSKPQKNNKSMTKSNKPLKKCRKGDVVELKEMNIFLKVPEETVSLEVTARLLTEDGNLVKVSRKLSPSEVRAQRQAFLDNVEDGDEYDAKFVLTEEGREYLGQLMEPAEGKEKVYA